MNTAIEPQLVAAHKPTPKRLRTLAAILDEPKTSFQLEQAPVWDHCANSTVSELRKAGIEILTEMVSCLALPASPPESRDTVLQRDRASVLCSSLGSTGE